MTTEPKALHPVKPLLRLSMAERIAVEALMAENVRVQKRIRDLFVEMGLDPDKRYSVQEDGTVAEA